MKLAFIGFGEAGQAFAAGIARARISGAEGFDLRADRVAEMAALQVLSGERESVLAEADVVWCLVTADRAAEAATDCSAFLPKGALWFDGNSCSPGTKARAAAMIEAVGGRYVDVAIMAPVHPEGAQVPLLVSGPHAGVGAEVLRLLGMVPTVVGDRVGQASTIKMMRSVMIKGIEALTAECLLGARAAGVEARVVASLQASDPGFDWAARSAYNFERMARHGTRRAAEMREVARTLRELGVPDRMASATADWQASIGALGLVLDAEAPVSSAADTVLTGLSRDL